uniref:Putative secreted protein n=1 Tax=Amblyomma americanum TaxID=6943 RepID=A0A0C9SDI1_AMBAM
MHSVFACVAIFLALAAFHSKGSMGSNTVRQGQPPSSQGGCRVNNTDIPNNGQRNMRDPCALVTCTAGQAHLNKTCADVYEHDESKSKEQAEFPGCCGEKNKKRRPEEPRREDLPNQGSFPYAGRGPNNK